MISKPIKQSLINRRGQTLIEVVVTLGVALVIVTSIVVLVNASNRRATIARQSTQASKLAQEGMEIVRNIREGPNPNVKVGTRVDSSTTINCSISPFCTWRDLYTDTQGTLSACLYLDPLTKWNLIKHTVGGDCTDEQQIENIFDREIEISDDDIGGPPAYICSDADLGESEVKRVRVIVTWESPIGNQGREVVSCLSNWR